MYNRNGVSIGSEVLLSSVCLGVIVHVDLSPGKYRVGGSALAQCYNQLGDSTPDVDDPRRLASAFHVTQRLIQGNSSLHLVLDLAFTDWQPQQPGVRFTNIVLRFILRHVIRSSYDKS